MKPACLQLPGTPINCEQLTGALLALSYAEGLTYQDVACTPIDPNESALDPSGCNCAAVIDSPGGGSGTYSLAGDVITTSSGAEYSYCVEGNTLTLTPTKFADGTSTTNTGTVVLQR